MRIIDKVGKYIWALGCLFMLLGCDKDEENGPAIDELPGKITGIGEAPGTPEGDTFVLPNKMKVTKIEAHEFWSAPDACKYDGTGLNVAATLTLETDSTGAPTRVVFPPGLILVSVTEQFQHGLLLDSVVVVVPPKVPGGGGGTCKVTLLMSCLNASRDPSDSDATYVLGPVTSSPLLKDFMKRLATKKTLSSQYGGINEDYQDNMLIVQQALWSITDGEGLTEEDEENIKSLPNK